MRITYLKLIGYIGIFNGLGLQKIEIDFSKCRNNITLLVGSNGSGKSTLQKAMTPFPDGNENFTPGKNAEKDINIITSDGILYSMQMIHPISKSGTRATPKCYIQRQGVELNQEGAVTSYKDIICEEFGLDSNYISLSRISSDSRGIADMLPSQRKKYISSILSSIETFNNMNKTFTKKANICKSHLNGLEAKIRALGNETELRNNLIVIDKQYKFLNAERDRLLKEKTQAEDYIALTDKTGTLQSEYQALYDNMKNTKEEISRLSKKKDNLLLKCKGVLNDNEMISDAKVRYTNLVNELNTKIEVAKASLDHLIIDREQLSLSITNSQEKMKNLKNSSDVNNLQEAVKILTIRIQEQEKIFDLSQISDYDTSKTEFLFIYQILTHIKTSIDDIRRNYDNECIQTTIETLQENKAEELPSNIKKLNDKKLDASNQLISLNAQIVDTNNEITTTTILNDRPKECKIDTCPLISNALSIMKSKPQEKLKQLEKQKKDLEITISKLDSTIPAMEMVYNCLNELNKVIEYITTNTPMLNKMPISHIFTDYNEFLIKMHDNSMFEEIDYSSKYIERAEDIEDYRENKSKLVELQSELKIAMKEMKEVDELDKACLNDQAKYKEIIDKISKINTDIDFNKNLISTYNEYIVILSGIEDIENQLIDLTNKQNDYNTQYQTIKDNIAQIKVYIDKINQISTQLLQVDKDIEPLSTQKDKINYALLSLAQYNDEYETYKNTYNKYNKLKLYSSPTNDSIQVLFISEYMTRMLDLSNSILSLLFNGQYKLLPFVIDGDNFRIPFIGNGLAVDDVSSASTSQICMIGMIISLVLAYQSAPSYKISYLDEIDGGLDSTNRASFIDVLYHVIDILKIDQLVMISHNLEADLNNVDVIKLKSDGIGQDFDNANIIYDYNKEIV